MVFSALSTHSPTDRDFSCVTFVLRLGLGCSIFFLSLDLDMDMNCTVVVISDSSPPTQQLIFLLHLLLGSSRVSGVVTLLSKT